MSAVLKWGGAIWAILGVGNIVTALSSHPAPAIGAFALIFNVVLFCIPGLVLYALGDRMSKPKSDDITARLDQLKQLHAGGHITSEEFDLRRAEILKSV